MTGNQPIIRWRRQDVHRLHAWTARHRPELTDAIMDQIVLERVWEHCPGLVAAVEASGRELEALILRVVAEDGLPGTRSPGTPS